MVGFVDVSAASFPTLKLGRSTALARRHKCASIEIGKLTIFNESECEAPPGGKCQKSASFVSVFHSVVAIRDVCVAEGVGAGGVSVCP